MISLSALWVTSSRSAAQLLHTSGLMALVTQEFKIQDVFQDGSRRYPERLQMCCIVFFEVPFLVSNSEPYPFGRMWFLSWYTVKTSGIHPIPCFSNRNSYVRQCRVHCRQVQLKHVLDSHLRIRFKAVPPDPKRIFKKIGIDFVYLWRLIPRAFTGWLSDPQKVDLYFIIWTFFWVIPNNSPSFMAPWITQIFHCGPLCLRFPMVPHVPKAGAIDETAIQKKTIHPRPGRRTGLENGDMLKGYFKAGIV